MLGTPCYMMPGLTCEHGVCAARHARARVAAVQAAQVELARGRGYLALARAIAGTGARTRKARAA